MFSTKQEIIEHHEEIRNKIDLKSEQLLLTLNRTNQNKLEQIGIINSLRETLVKKITELETFNLSNFNKHTKFCFFISNSKAGNDEINDGDKWNFNFKNDLGVMIILNEILSNKILNQIENLINKKSEYSLIEEDTLGSFKSVIKTKIILDLIDSKFDNLIIDLTKVEDNSIENLEISCEEYYLDEKENLNFLPKLICLEKVQTLDLSHSCDNEIPNGIFTSGYKMITKLLLNSNTIGVLHERIFENLINLSHLEITDCSIEDFEKNTFFGLKNLKKLDLSGNSLEEINKEVFKGLDSLEILDLSNNEISCLETNNFIYLKNLLNLYLNENPVGELEKNCFNGLSKLRVLSFNKVTAEIEDVSKNLLAPLNNLEILDFGNAIIFDELTPFKPSDSLKFLSCIHSLKFVNEFRNLEFLDLLNSDPICKISQITLENLKFLGIKMEKVQKFGANFKNLKALQINDVCRFTPDWAENLHSLDYLNILIQECDLVDRLKTKDFDHLKNIKYFKVWSMGDLEDSFKSKKNIFMKMFAQKEKVKVNCFTDNNGYDSDEEEKAWRYGYPYLGGLDTALCFMELKECESDKEYFEKILNVSQITCQTITDSAYTEEFFSNNLRI
ncbi:unnamed protein product [Brachionus calyciflorus]|uniref:Uncharacterized protein n=1 Tax=Brachionus calyciflorus TaxID=104777 RepID=A0A813VA11_9BILA|nr:unnamed protein product [Brachionus calyciflorus]